MEYQSNEPHIFFNLDKDANNTVHLTRRLRPNTKQPPALTILEAFVGQIITLLASRDLTGIIYECPVDPDQDGYAALLSEATEPGFVQRLQKLLANAIQMHTAKIPVIGLIDKPLSGVQAAPLLWGQLIIGTKDAVMSFPEVTIGLFPGLGATTFAARKLSTKDACTLLIKAQPANMLQGIHSKLIYDTAPNLREALALAKELIEGHPDGFRVNATDDSALQEDLAAFKRKANPRFGGIIPCFEIIEAAKTQPLEQVLMSEAQKFAEVLQAPSALAALRTFHYGVQNASNKARKARQQEAPLQKAGIIGAGMMGAGIAFEMAKAGISTYLKDRTVALAEKGKSYSEKCADKLIALSKISEKQKTALLANIHPTDRNSDLNESDFIIEAVFEQKALKAEVISQSAPYLKPGGIFASNTTSLPISALAGHLNPPENFIGMHFFSPVDRMPLVEIILGEKTSASTLNKAMAVSATLNKIPILVHDSPAFFTSRIFFNYLLEAITMCLEGTPAAAIEKEAIQAGFAVSPLAVLDEISLPLMVHVYDQLPGMSSSQKRCYDYLTSLISQQREGRRAGKGFYNYDLATGKKQIWQDPSIQAKTEIVSPDIIQKRLLHVMALDSYRCLDEGVLDRPIDGDIGSIMGVGYAAHTGGAIAHIDQVGLAVFVEQCDCFGAYGEQWDVPDSLRKLAAQNYSFYTGLNANWPVTK